MGEESLEHPYAMYLLAEINCFPVSINKAMLSIHFSIVEFTKKYTLFIKCHYILFTYIFTVL